MTGASGRQRWWRLPPSLLPCPPSHPFCELCYGLVEACGDNSGRSDTSAYLPAHQPLLCCSWTCSLRRLACTEAPPFKDAADSSPTPISGAQSEPSNPAKSRPWAAGYREPLGRVGRHSVEPACWQAARKGAASSQASRRPNHRDSWWGMLLCVHGAAAPAHGRPHGPPEALMAAELNSGHTSASRIWLILKRTFVLLC